MKLEALNQDQCQIVREWRNEEPQFLRTPYSLTEEMQDEFYDTVVCNRGSQHRYFALVDDDCFIGMGGITNIEWENGCAEISLILDPEARGQCLGKKAVRELLRHAFNNMRLETVYGEVYECGNLAFWLKCVEYFVGYSTTLKRRKVYNGILYDSMWFCFSSEIFSEEFRCCV